MSMYKLGLNSTLGNIALYEVIEKRMPQFEKTANSALYAVWKRECDGHDLVMDLYLTFRNKAKKLEKSAFTESFTQGVYIINALIHDYAKSTAYTAGIRDLVKAQNACGPITLCSLENCLDKGEDVEKDEETTTVDVIFASKFIESFDSMKDDGELSIKAKLNLIRLFAAEVATSPSPEALIGEWAPRLREILDLGPDSPDELKNAMYVALRAGI